MSFYLDFEKPLRSHDEAINALKAESGLSVQQTKYLGILEDERKKEIKSIFSNFLRKSYLMPLIMLKIVKIAIFI